jgi:SAM-dependent methyltransferase
LAGAELERIAGETLAYYEQNAESFRAGTLDHDVSQNIDALLRHINARPPYHIVDFGCGPGRDLKALALRGHTAIGLDGTARFVTMARSATGCEVWQQDFLKLELPAAHFDGVFANASLFHVPTSELCSLVLTRGVITARAGTAGATGPTMTWSIGSATFSWQAL